MKLTLLLTFLAGCAPQPSADGYAITIVSKVAVGHRRCVETCVIAPGSDEPDTCAWERCR